MHKKIIITGLAVVIVTVVALLTLHVALAPKSQEGLRGRWTAQQKTTAQGVLTAPPVSESAALAACVVSKISSQSDYSQFAQYTKMAADNNFDNPNSDQSSVIQFLEIDAMSCPEAG